MKVPRNHKQILCYISKTNSLILYKDSSKMANLNYNQSS